MVARKAHLLSKPQKVTTPESIIFVDCETTQEKKSDGKVYHHLMLGVAIYTRHRKERGTRTKEVYRFKTNADFWDFVLSRTLRRKVLYLISHNATFDFTVLEHMTYLSDAGYNCIFVYEGSMRFISKWRNDNNTIMILDNSNWFAGKLERWGKELNLPKLTMPKGVSNEEKWYTYCERDTEILYQLYLWYNDFLLANDLGTWKYTIASSAFTSYRHRFMYYPISIPDNTTEQQLARQSYHGGRTECFRVGQYQEGLFYKLDINSMYPYVMREYEYPTCLEGEYTDPSISKILGTLERKAIIADCTVRTTIPYFCFKHGKRNVYPIGEFRTTLTSQELELAVKNDWLVKVHNCVVYRKRPIFIDYVDFFYQIKHKAGLEGKHLLRSFAKLYLNSLYGKFGQRGYEDTIIAVDPNFYMHAGPGINARTGERFYIRQVGNTIIRTVQTEESYNSFCAIASEVTANARLYLYDLVTRAHRENCFYCDTDSIIINEEGYDNLKHLLSNDRLGYLKIEGLSEEIEIVAPKHYMFDGHWTMKGIRKDATKLSTNSYSQEIWPGFNTILKSEEEIYFNYYQVKTLNPNIVSGIVTKGGFILPFNCVKNEVYYP